MRKKWVFWSLMSLVGWFLLFLLWPWNKPLFDSPYATLLVDRENVLLGATIADDGQWRFPPSDSIPKKYIQAVLQYEDRDFYNHPGISIKAIIRATIQNIQEGRVVSGGSTLTMQTVRMMRGNQSRTFFEKFIELFYAFKLDHTHSKEEILKMYAFHAPFGGNVVGIEAASWRYFGRKSYELTWAEIATLAVLPNSPSLIYPGKNSTRLREKRNRLLKRLWDVNLIDEETYNLALLEELPGKPFPLPGLTPHLLTRAINEGRKGEYIESTLSRKLQVWTEGRIESHMEALRANGVYNAAALILDVKTGETLAYVGNVNSGEEHGQDVDIITAQRSPGSLLKPFLYAFSIDKGIISPYQMLPDVPTFYRDFTPENFDHKFYGAVNANYALARSLNVPFVNLLKEYGYEQFHHDMQQAGMESLTHPASHYGLSLILGGAETSLWEISSLYAALVRLQNPLQKNIAFFQNRYVRNQVTQPLDFSINPISAYYAIHAMEQVVRPDTESGWEYFNSSKDIAWKTGTSVGFRDAWAMGINDQYLVGVWTGNADGEGRPSLTGVSSSAPIMFDLFEMLKGKSDYAMDFTNTVEKKLCLTSGLIAGEACINTRMVFLPKSNNGIAVCDFHKIIHLTEDEKYRVHGDCYPVSRMKRKSWFVLPPVQAVYYKKYNLWYSPLPTYLSGCESEVRNNDMALIYPKKGGVIYIPKEVDGKRGKLVVKLAHAIPDTKVYWHLDEDYLGVTVNNHEMALQPDPGKHTLYFVDENGKELTMPITIGELK